MNRDGSLGPGVEARRALVLHDRPLVVDLIRLTLNHGLFVVRAAGDLAEAESILVDWRPHMTIVDMDHDDSSNLLQRLGASNSLRRSVTPVLGLTRRGDLQTKLKAFDLGVDDILTVPFSPEELLARSIVISRRAAGRTCRSSRPSSSARSRSTSQPPGPHRPLRGAIERDRTEPAVSPGESWRTRGHGRRSSTLMGHRLRGREQRRRSPYPKPADQAARRLPPSALHRDRPGQGYRFVPTFSNAGWVEMTSCHDLATTSPHTRIERPAVARAASSSGHFRC